ncbi:MAG: tripartite tricarboxylate transporter substrate binding protein [Thiothrix sp.]|nr:tripartite tricarboxylate transporter substrate binding protein [Thiothrix sp.]HPQ96702.1 tripartite tricarboxylate transporter substrate binding protein [Thiolinea sp.]
MKKTLLALSVAALTTFASFSAVAEYPDKDIQGIIAWGAGGSTDTVMRSVTPHAEKVLGTSVVMTNRTGGVGAIATKFVQAQKADGYTLLMNAENPQLYKVMGLGDMDYGDFTTVTLLARGTPVLVARNDAPYNTFKEFVEYTQANPKGVKVGSTGPGGLTSVVVAMLQAENPMELTNIPYDGDGPALTALQGGAIDVMPAVLGAALEHIKAGRMKVLGLVSNEPSPLIDAQPITDDYPGYGKYLPWGPFFGIFVKKGTPDDIVAKLADAYEKGTESEDFKKLMEDRGFTIMAVHGDEADQFLKRWQSVTSWLLQDAGATKKSPEEFGIPKPE